MARIETIDGNDNVDTRRGEPRIARMSLCGGRHDYMTYSGQCTRCEEKPRILYCVIGSDYGFLHNSSGDIRNWKSQSGARKAAKQYKAARS